MTTEINLSELPGTMMTRMPRQVSPQLAVLTDCPPDGDDWLHEIKLDGYRMLCFIQQGKVRFQSRSGKDWTAKFPQLVRILQRQQIETVFDGEVLVLDASGRSDFQALQSCMKGTADRVVMYYVFDLVWCAGYQLFNVPLIRRKQLLETILQKINHQQIVYTRHVLGQGQHFYRQACQLSLEGMVSKHTDSMYVERRSSSWLKVKCQLRQEFVIGGYSDPRGRRTSPGALLLGVFHGDDLQYCGRVGTGMDQDTRSALLQRLQRLECPTPGFAQLPHTLTGQQIHWVTPRLVAEVRFAEWTRDGLLRHPVFVGLREDKSATMVQRERSGEMPAVQLPADIHITHPDKILYLDQGITKSQIAAYYISIASRLLPHISDRPLTVIRCPNGTDTCFYQKHRLQSMPAAIHGVTVSDHKQQLIMINDVPGLIALVQLGAIEFHPWGSRVDKVDYPDRMIFDLDPDEGLPTRQIIEGAILIKLLLDELGLECWIKTSGGKGFHIVVPLLRRSDWSEVKEFSRLVVAELVKRDPKRFIDTMNKRKRPGKIFVDYLRNVRGATNVAPFSLRARPTAPVSVPISWAQLPYTSPDRFRWDNISGLLDKDANDPWEGIFTSRQMITKKMKQQLTGQK